jgi:hypothetical protein
MVRPLPAPCNDFENEPTVREATLPGYEWEDFADEEPTTAPFWEAPLRRQQASE